MKLSVQYFLYNFRIFLLLLLHFFFVLNSDAQAVSDMLEKALPSVVTVVVYKADSGNIKKMLGFNTRGHADPDIAYKRILELKGIRGSGSGFIIRYNDKKYVITNLHVVEHAADDGIYAFTISQKKYLMKLLGGDTFYDIAVL